MWFTDDPKGFVFEKINEMQTKVYHQLVTSRSTERQRLLGFVIQVMDIFRSKHLDDVAGLLIAPERKKVELILSCFSAFSHLVYERIIRNHKTKDSNLDPNQFDEDELLEALNKNVEEKDWIDVGALAMMLNQKEKLKRDTLEISYYSIEYAEKKGII